MLNNVSCKCHCGELFLRGRDPPNILVDQTPGEEQNASYSSQIRIGTKSALEQQQNRY